jgi:septum formation protein
VIARQFPDAVVLAADTLVVFGDTILGKPDDADRARQMLGLLGGTTHLVITGVAVHRASEAFQRMTRVISAVQMRKLSAVEIEQYVATNDWRGKAGGYGIQDDDPFVTRMSGSMANIVGLPMDEARALLKEAGIEPARMVHR